VHGIACDISSVLLNVSIVTGTVCACGISSVLLQIVGVGLISVFELIHETQTTHPSLCNRALQALFDILQGQPPEGLRAEPADTIGELVISHQLRF